jgi:anti-sigma regulatory factor (Ser/Thr protein kinase)
MTMEPRKELRIKRAATDRAPSHMRREIRAFLTELNVSQRVIEDVLTAISEAVANAVEHGYSGGDPGDVELAARVEADRTLHVEVADTGEFLDRDRLPDRGLGLTLIRSFARSTEIVRDGGTRIKMVFDLVR